MKYTKFKKIAESEGYKLHIDYEDQGYLFIDNIKHKLYCMAAVNLGTSGDYEITSLREFPVSIRMATAIAEFSLTSWIEREVPDKEDENDENDD